MRHDDDKRTACSLIQNIEKLEAWFHKRLTPEQKEIYIEALCNLSDLAFTEIVQEIIYEHHPSPSHFPTINRVKARWHTFQQRHKAVVDYEIEQCEYCHGKGFIFFQKRIGDIPYEMCGRCPKCQNWKRSTNPKALPVVYKESLIEQGFEVWPYPLPWEKKPDRIEASVPERAERKLGQITENIGKKI